MAKQLRKENVPLTSKARFSLGDIGAIALLFALVAIALWTFVLPAKFDISIPIAYGDGDSLQSSANVVQECLKEDLAEDKGKARIVEVPVCYDPEFAPDIEDVAKKLNLSLKELAERHAASEHRVLMIGFAPGHAYMGGLDPKLAVPRRATPRANVPEGSVAIANDQTVVYPYTIPGGWSIIGRTPLTVFDAGRAEPSLFAPGDRVRFRIMSKEEFLGEPR